LWTIDIPLRSGERFDLAEDLASKLTVCTGYAIAVHAPSYTPARVGETRGGCSMVTLVGVNCHQCGRIAHRQMITW